MSKYACVRTDNMSGTRVEKDLVSLKINSDIENGTILKVGGLVANERELRTATIPAVGAALADLALVATPEVVKDKANYNISDFINKANEAIRGYRLTSKSVFSVTKEAFAAGQNPAVTNLVELNGSGKLIAVAENTQDSTVIGTVIAIEDEWYVIEVA